MEQDRLTRCLRCGELRGEALVDDRWEGPIYLRVLCHCDGIACHYCKRSAIHRPISNRYDEATGTVWHVPHFGWQFPCPACRRQLGAERGKPLVLRLPDC